MRVNYASLNVEEFGSVYEGMLEYDPIITKQAGVYQFDFVKGSGRSSSGSHYTPDELVQPLIKHSLDYVIEDRLKSSDKKSEKEKALLSIKVCDVACGSGHILLNAARRIGAELAKVRAGEDQPSPAPLRQAIRDVIKSCIYGVDKNPLAVELCKVALWLEAHNPGEPLNFLDHHIKCGDAIVGLAHKEELENGIADEAFKNMPGDDKDIRAELAKRNKRERKDRKQRHFDFGESVGGSFADISMMFDRFNKLPESTIEEIEYKRKEYVKMSFGAKWLRLKILADIQVAQFFITKDETNVRKIVTDEEYMDYLSGTKPIHPMKAGKAGGIAGEKRFFHWFLEFPVVFAGGGFDCILGNPPYLGGQSISGNFGHKYLNFLTHYYTPASNCDLVTYFFRRIYSIIKYSAFLGLLTTNTISQGNSRVGGLDFALKKTGSIIYAFKNKQWPGRAAVFISLIILIKDFWEGKVYLNEKKVESINSLLNEGALDVTTYPLKMNNECFMGSTPFGKGFFINKNKANEILESNPRYHHVLLPVLNGDDFLNDYNQEPTRYIINFWDWDLEKSKTYPLCFEIVQKTVKPQRESQKIISAKKYWWRFHRLALALYKAISKNKRVLVTPFTSKYCVFAFLHSKMIFSNATIVFSNEKYSFFTVLQSSIYDSWIQLYGSTLETRIRYSPSDVYENFPFPQKTNKLNMGKLDLIGERYDHYRGELMKKVQIGLTKTYNQFHNPDLRGFSNDDIATISTLKAKESQKQYGKETVNLWKHIEKTEGICTFNEAVHDILHLRELHKQMDETVLKAYGWEDIDLAHNFYEVDYLPENDRVRYTISPDARKEVLKRLLKLNYEIHEQEVKAGLHAKGKTKKKKSKNKQKSGAPKQINLF